MGISLKLADIFARRGDLTNAEIGYRHCISKQMKVMDDRKCSRLLAAARGSSGLRAAAHSGERA